MNRVENTLTPHWGNLTRDTNTGTARVGTIVDGIDGHIVFRLSAGDVLSKQRVEEEIAITPALKEIFDGQQTFLDNKAVTEADRLKRIRMIQASMNWAIVPGSRFNDERWYITIAVTYVDPDLMPYTEEERE